MDEIYEETIPFSITKLVLGVLIVLTILFPSLFVYQISIGLIGTRPAPDWCVKKGSDFPPRGERFGFFGPDRYEMTRPFALSLHGPSQPFVQCGSAIIGLPL